MHDITQDRLDLLRQLAAETQKRVTAKGVKPARQHRDGTSFKSVTLVEVERSELIFLCEAIKDEKARGEPIWLAQEQGSRLATSETVAIKLSDLHWLLSYAPQRPEPESDEADTEPTNEAAADPHSPYVANTAVERADEAVESLERALDDTEADVPAPPEVEKEAAARPEVETASDVD